MEFKVFCLMFVPLALFGARVTPLPPMTPDGTLTNDVSFGWQDGAIIWYIPLGWNVKDTTGDTPPYKQFGGNLQQVFMIDRHGRVGVFKLDNWVERTTNDVVTLYGPLTKKDE